MTNHDKTPQPNDPLHGISLKKILETLVDKYTWEDLASMIRINCFIDNPSIQSSLKFLRKTPWAREKVEELYINGVENNNPETLELNLLLDL